MALASNAKWVIKQPGTLTLWLHGKDTGFVLVQGKVDYRSMLFRNDELIGNYPTLAEATEAGIRLANECIAYGTYK